MDVRKLLGAAEEMLVQRNVESVLFQGMKMLVQTNGEKLEWLAGELIKEDERRKNSPLPKVLVKQVMTPRISFSQIRELSYNGQYGTSGSIVNVMADT